MEMVAKISTGSKMDQIYLPKNRLGFASGTHVVISSFDRKDTLKKSFKPFFYNTTELEFIKIEIINKIFEITSDLKLQNIIITGSFLEKGFRFNDIDILLISEEKIETDIIENKLEKLIGVKMHVLSLNLKSLNEGLSTDPIYSMMLSKCTSRERIIFNVKRKINYKLLDLHLLKSKILVENFDLLNGEEKYYLVLNLFSIAFFMNGEKLSREIIERSIEKELNIKIKDLKGNVIQRKAFIKKYEEMYSNTFNKILENIN